MYRSILIIIDFSGDFTFALIKWFFSCGSLVSRTEGIKFANRGNVHFCRFLRFKRMYLVALKLMETSRNFKILCFKVCSVAVYTRAISYYVRIYYRRWPLSHPSSSKKREYVSLFLVRSHLLGICSWYDL